MKKHCFNYYSMLLLLGTGMPSFAEYAADFKALEKGSFELIYKSRAWGDKDSVSGPGSNMEQTEVIRKALPAVLKEYDIEVLFDIPCGDCYWITKIENMPIKQYVGIDLVEPLIRENIKQYAHESRIFIAGDLTTMDLKSMADKFKGTKAILCRDCLPHLCFANIRAAIQNIKKSGATYLITSTYPKRTENLDFRPADYFNLLRFRPLNFQIEPFNFPKPLKIILEKNSEGQGWIADKCLAVWRIADLP